MSIDQIDQPLQKLLQDTVCIPIKQDKLTKWIELNKGFR